MLALAACGGRTGDRAGAAPATPLAVPRVTGEWQWARAGAQGDAWVIERERWHLQAAVAGVTGTCDREVLVLSPDGAPFSCSQSPAYRLRTRYAVTGRSTRTGFALAEVAVAIEPSPCESEHRRRVTYQASRVGDALVLSWPGGRQHLVPAAALEVPAARPAGRVDGHYRWQARTADLRRGTSVELEDWRLVEDDHGRLTGHYVRRVTAYHDDGDALACDGALRHEYVDRVELDGLRVGDAIALTETGGVLADHPCSGGRRSLDAARGVAYPGYLELEWRGQGRQVLERVAP